jgi:hypothetical protein
MPLLVDLLVLVLLVIWLYKPLLAGAAWVIKRMKKIGQDL